MTQENTQGAQQSLNLSGITLNQDIVGVIAELQSKDTFETDTYLDTIAQLIRKLIAEADATTDPATKNRDVSFAQGLLQIETVLKTLALRK